MQTLLFVLCLAVILIVAGFVIAWATGKSRLRDLSPEARERYVNSWRDLEPHFVDAPRETVRKADTLVRGLLAERGHDLDARRLPRRMRHAHEVIATIEGDDPRDTEALRQAFIELRRVMSEYTSENVHERQRTGRREVA